jgi:hypothetical protein
MTIREQLEKINRNITELQKTEFRSVVRVERDGVGHIVVVRKDAPPAQPSAAPSNAASSTSAPSTSAPHSGE